MAAVHAVWTTSVTLVNTAGECASCMGLLWMMFAFVMKALRVLNVTSAHLAIMARIVRSIASDVTFMFHAMKGLMGNVNAMKVIMMTNVANVKLGRIVIPTVQCAMNMVHAQKEWMAALSVSSVGMEKCAKHVWTADMAQIVSLTAVSAIYTEHA